MTPGLGYHQHFNVSAGPTRYLVLRYDNPGYTGALGAKFKYTGGTNLEFEDEDPAIRETFVEELRRRNVECSMPPDGG